MARTVKPEEFAAKRREILAAAQRLVFTKGYERMAIRDILNELHISSGAFHHYFGSRAALLEAFIEQIRQDAEQPLLSIVHDPQRSAIEKLQSFLDTLDQLRAAQQALVVDLLRVWYTDENALVRQKVDAVILAQRAPLLTAIVRQGLQEGVFTTPYPDEAGEIIQSLLQAMGRTHAQWLLTLAHAADEQPAIDAIVTTHAAYLEAIERVLGAPRLSLRRTDLAAVKARVSPHPHPDQV